MKLFIYSGKTVRIDGDFARYVRCEERNGKRVHILYYAETDEYGDFEETSGERIDSTYEAYNVEQVGVYYDNPEGKEKNRNYFKAKPRYCY